MKFRRLESPFDTLLAVVGVGAGIAAAGTGILALQMVFGTGVADDEIAPSNVIPVGHTIYGNANAKYVATAMSASHAQCALEICPALNASLACVEVSPSGRFVGYGWIGLYQDPAATGAEMGWWWWTSGCESKFRRWKESEPKWRGGIPERCAFATFHQKAGDGSPGEAELGGGIFSDPCWAEKPCICEYGATTTDDYSSAAVALIAEEAEVEERKPGMSTTIVLLFCACTVSCFCIVAVFVYFWQPQAHISGVQTDEVPQKLAEGSPVQASTDAPLKAAEGSPSTGDVDAQPRTNPADDSSPDPPQKAA
jgi:hypothetical protein